MLQNDDNTLSRWIGAIGQEEQTPGPSNEVVARTLWSIGQIELYPKLQIRRICTIAAGIGIAIGLAAMIWLLAFPGEPAVTWGDVLATVNQAHTMVCRMEIHVEATGDSPHAQSDIGKLMIKSPGLRREEQPGWIIITNWPARKQLSLNTEKKIATVSDLTGDMPQDTNPIQTFDELKNLKDAQSLGRRDVDGVTAIGFRFHHDSQMQGTIVHYVNDVWADAKTHRITQCVIDADTTSTPDLDHPWDLSKWRQQKIHVVIGDIQWNVSLSDSLFSINPPTGYRVVIGTKIQTQIIK